MSPKLQQVIQVAKRVPRVQFTSLAHLLTPDLYRQAWKRLDKGSSPGIDAVTAGSYVQNLEMNLQRLHEHVKTGTYQAPPARRVYIPKESGGQRAIAIPCLEDKIVQGAVRILLEGVFEQDFLPFSYGFRPGRNPHQALEALWAGIMRGQVSCVLDADIQGFFDTLDHQWLMRFVKHRINDRTILKLIGKWLHAGVMTEEGKIDHPEAGSPQGGVISPVLSNIYLHYVLDLWVHHRMSRQMRGKMFMVRYADDVIFAFEYRDDAERFLGMLKERLAKFNLKLHPDKTRIVDFGRPGPGSGGSGTSGTFDFLGFMHYWGRSRKGNFVVRRATSGKRLRRFLKRIWQWCKAYRHKPVAEQADALTLKLRGHYQYYGVTHNYPKIAQAYWYVCRTWHYWLNRRSQRCGANWTWFRRMIRRFRLPLPHLTHSVFHASLQGELF